MRGNIDVWEWIFDVSEWLAAHSIDLFFGVIFVLFLAGMILFAVGYPVSQEREIQDCMRLFERTHDQCAFMIRNHVVP